MKLIERKFSLGAEAGTFEITETKEVSNVVDVRSGINMLLQTKARIAGSINKKTSLEGQLDKMCKVINDDLVEVRKNDKDALDSAFTDILVDVSVEDVLEDKDNLPTGDSKVSPADSIKAIVMMKTEMKKVADNIKQIEGQLKQYVTMFNADIQMLIDANDELKMNVKGIPDVLVIEDVLAGKDIMKKAE